MGRSAHGLQDCWYSRVHLPGDVKEGVRTPEKELVLKGFESMLSLGKLKGNEDGKDLVLEPNPRT